MRRPAGRRSRSLASDATGGSGHAGRRDQRNGLSRLLESRRVPASGSAEERAERRHRSGYCRGRRQCLGWIRSPGVRPDAGVGSRRRRCDRSNGRLSGRQQDDSADGAGPGHSGRASGLDGAGGFDHRPMGGSRDRRRGSGGRAALAGLSSESGGGRLPLGLPGSSHRLEYAHPGRVCARC